MFCNLTCPAKMRAARRSACASGLSGAATTSGAPPSPASRTARLMGISPKTSSP